MSPGPGPGVVEPATLLRLIEDSGHSVKVIEEAVRLLRRGLACIDTQDPALLDVLRHHLLAVGSPTDVTKYFSLELLERASPTRAEEVAIELVELLARCALLPERAYHVERAVLRTLGERKVSRALPGLALVAARGVFPISRTAAKAAVAIAGSSDPAELARRLAQENVPRGSAPSELASAIVSALACDPRPTPTNGNGSHVLAENSDRFLRPEPKQARQARLRAVLRAAGRDPSRCGNCDLAGKMTIVHVVPTSRGGTERAGNLIALCNDCKRRLPRKTRTRNAAARKPDAPQMSLFG